MSLRSIPFSFYGIFREPVRLARFIKLALKGFDGESNSYYQGCTGKKNETIFYVGHHDDEHLFFLSRLAGSLGKLVVFTTTRNAYNQLNHLVTLLGLKNVIAVPITFSIESNEEIIFAAQPAIKEIVNIATLIDAKQTKAYKKIEISYEETLDNYCYFQDIHPQMLEIKLPWHEMAVLKGARKILKKYKPVLVIECDVRFSTRAKIQEVFTMLTDTGYQGHFKLDGLRIPINNFDFDLYQNPKSNFYCKEFVFE